MARENRPKPKRRGLRFRMRTFLVVLTIFCVWLGWFLYRVERQQETVAWVIGNGGNVRYDFEFSGGRAPFVPEWLREMLGVDCFSTIVSVGFYSDNTMRLPLSDVTPLASLTNLEGLRLAGTQVSDLTPIAKLTNLKELDLATTQISDVTPLAGLTNLKRLKLFGTRVSDVTPLAGLTNLEELVLSKTQVSDEQIDKLKQALPNCRIIR